VQPFEAREELWDELQETFQPILGDNYMMSIADSLREEGMQQGMQQGMHIKEVQIAKNLLGSGLDVGFVAQTTGLDVALLQKLKEETKH
jgi:predicted transposase YdaD